MEVLAEGGKKITYRIQTLTINGVEDCVSGCIRMLKSLGTWYQPDDKACISWYLGFLPLNLTFLLEVPISEKYTLLLTVRVRYLDADLFLVHFLSPPRLRCQIQIQIPGWNHRKFLP